MTITPPRTPSPPVGSTRPGSDLFSPPKKPKRFLSLDTDEKVTQAATGSGAFDFLDSSSSAEPLSPLISWKPTHSPLPSGTPYFSLPIVSSDHSHVPAATPLPLPSSRPAPNSAVFDGQLEADADFVFATPSAKDERDAERGLQNIREHVQDPNVSEEEKKLFQDWLQITLGNRTFTHQGKEFRVRAVPGLAGDHAQIYEVEGETRLIPEFENQQIYLRVYHSVNGAADFKRQLKHQKEQYLLLKLAQLPCVEILNVNEMEQQGFLVVPKIPHEFVVESHIPFIRNFLETCYGLEIDADAHVGNFRVDEAGNPLICDLMEIKEETFDVILPRILESFRKEYRQHIDPRILEISWNVYSPLQLEVRGAQRLFAEIQVLKEEFKKKIEKEAGIQILVDQLNGKISKLCENGQGSFAAEIHALQEEFKEQIRKGFHIKIIADQFETKIAELRAAFGSNLPLSTIKSLLKLKEALSSPIHYDSLLNMEFRFGNQPVISIKEILPPNASWQHIKHRVAETVANGNQTIFNFLMT